MRPRLCIPHLNKEPTRFRALMCTWRQKKKVYKLFLWLKEETFQAFMSSWEFRREAGSAEGGQCQAYVKTPGYYCSCLPCLFLKSPILPHHFFFCITRVPSRHDLDRLCLGFIRPEARAPGGQAWSACPLLHPESPLDSRFVVKPVTEPENDSEGPQCTSSLGRGSHHFSDVHCIYLLTG